MKKRLHFSAKNQFFIKLSCVHVKCTFDNCDDNFAWKIKFFFSNSEIDEKIEKCSKMFINLCSGDAKRSFVESTGKRSSEVKYPAVWIRNCWKVMFLREFCFVFRKSLCTNRMKIWWPCRTVPTIVRQNFLPKNQKLYKNCSIFQRGMKFSSNDRLYT